MAITRVQKAKGSATSSPVSASWGSPTTAGSFLVALLCHTANPGTYTAPSGWSQVGATFNNGTQLYCSLWDAVNAASQSGSQSWSWSGGSSPTRNALIIAEYSGVATSNPQDGSNQTNSGNSATPATGTLATSNASDLLIGLVCQSNTSDSNGITFSSPGGGFTLVDTQSSGTAVTLLLNLGFCEQIVSSTGSYQATVSSTETNIWAGILAGFSAAASGALWKSPSQRRRRPAALQPRDLYTW
jgi:hypothetical protein